MKLSLIFEYLVAKIVNYKGGKVEERSYPDGLKLSTFEFQGEGVHQPLICVHGLGSSAASYARFMNDAKSNFKRVVAASLPGHGLSPTLITINNPDQIYQIWEKFLLTESESEPICLLGNSLGGAVALRFTLHHPNRVAALILISPAGAPMNSTEIEHLRATFNMQSLFAGHRFMKQLYHSPPQMAWLIGFLIRENLKRDAVQQLLEKVQPEDGLSPEQLSHLKVPTLFIWGDRERILPTSSLEYYQSYLPSATQFVHPKSFSHSPHIEEPQAVLSYLKEWLQKFKCDER